MKRHLLSGVSRRAMVTINPGLFGIQRSCLTMRDVFVLLHVDAMRQVYPL